MTDFYYILGLNANCTQDDIKEAYRKLSKKFHPDANQGDKYFEERFKEVSEAYETLGDPDKRFQYDAGLKKSRSKYHSGKTEDRQYKDPRAFKKGPGIGMTVALLLVGLILGIYVVKSVIGSKQQMLRPATAISQTSLKTRQHHKRRHIFKNKTPADSFYSDTSPVGGDTGQTFTTVNKQPSATSAGQNIPVKNPPVLPDSGKSTHNSDWFLYATYVRANATGIVNMRESADYGSSIIETIPANAQVFVLQRGDAYYKVSYHNITGYVPGWSLQTK